MKSNTISVAQGVQVEGRNFEKRGLSKYRYKITEDREDLTFKQ